MMAVSHDTELVWSVYPTPLASNLKRKVDLHDGSGRAAVAAGCCRQGAHRCPWAQVVGAREPSTPKRRSSEEAMELGLKACC